ncbi:MAG TPA: VOC family protein [Bacteroidales bacterium]|nr:VOC family protein [Bacteroidales bacterium]
MKLNHIDHVAIICSDYQKSKYFYSEVLGMKVVREVYREGRNSWKCDLEVNGTYQIELFSFPHPPHRVSLPEAAGLRHLAFEVDNIDEIVDELSAKGIEAEPIRYDASRGNKRFTFIADPDGTPIEFCER